MIDTIDVAVCYHKPSILFESDALRPMQVGKACAGFDLGIRGDDAGDNISRKNRYYSEDTALYWLWKNSSAEIKGILHYRRLLDLSSQNGKKTTLVLEDIQSPKKVIDDLRLTKSHILKIMDGADALVGKKSELRDWFPGNVEEQLKATSIPEHLDWAMHVVKRDFPDIYPTARRAMGEDRAYFHNLCIMKSELFDSMCDFCFGVTEKLEKRVDASRPEIADGWRYTGRYLAIIFERMSSVYIDYLRLRGTRIEEFPHVYIAPAGTDINQMKNYGANAYCQKANSAETAVEPAFGGNAAAIMMATNNKYAPYCAAAIQSVIDNSDPKRNYDITVCSSGMSENNSKLLNSMSVPNVSVRAFDMRNVLKDVDLSVFRTRIHFSIETYFRFFIPKIFQKYDKILYLDVDMVALRDVAELYDTDIGDNWWGVVRDKIINVLGYSYEDTHEKKFFIPYIKKTLGMDSPFDYFQAGVMIWNIRRCAADGVSKKCLERLREIKEPLYVDQCVMNSVANGNNIFWLSGYWNVPWNVPFQWTAGYGSEMFDTAMHLLEDPFILHFCGDAKPWIEPDRPNAEKFWRYARKTPFYEMMLAELKNPPPAAAGLFLDNRSGLREKLRRKVRKYKILQFLTFGLVKTFKSRKAKYRRDLECLTNN